MTQDNKNELNLEKLEQVSGGTLKNISALETYIMEQKKTGKTLNQIISVVVCQPTYYNYTDDTDIFGLITYTTDFYNTLPGAKGAFIGGDIIDL